MMMESKLAELEGERREAVARLRRALRRSRRIAPRQLLHDHPYAAAGVAMAAGAVLAFAPPGLGRGAAASRTSSNDATEKKSGQGFISNARETVQLVKQVMEALLLARGAAPFGAAETPPPDMIPARVGDVEGYALTDPAW